MLPQRYIPSPVGEEANPMPLLGPHSHAAAVHQDAQMSSYTHQGRKEAVDPHSSDQQMTIQNSTERSSNSTGIAR